MFPNIKNNFHEISFVNRRFTVVDYFQWFEVVNLYERKCWNFIKLNKLVKNLPINSVLQFFLGAHHLNIRCKYYLLSTTLVFANLGVANKFGLVANSFYKLQKNLSTYKFFFESYKFFLSTCKQSYWGLQISFQQLQILPQIPFSKSKHPPTISKQKNLSQIETSFTPFFLLMQM